MKLFKYQPECSVEGCTDGAQIEWKDDRRNSDTWFYSDCDTCWFYFCEYHHPKHTEKDEHPELLGMDVCLDCLADREIRERIQCENRR